MNPRASGATTCVTRSRPASDLTAPASSARSVENACGSAIRGVASLKLIPGRGKSGTSRIRERRSTPDSAGHDGVADGDLAAAMNRRPQAAAMHQPTQHAWLRQPLEVRARLAQLDSLALDLADAKAPPDEGVQVDPPR